jgi:apolipoprotein N-acyltransferase
MELARTYLITGFPWNLLGYAVQASGVRQIATVTGVCGLSFAAVTTSALLAGALRGGAKIENGKSKLEARSALRISIFEFRFSSFLPLLGWLGLLLVAQWRLAPPPATEGRELAILIQPNVPLDDAALDAWVPWHDPTQLRELVQFSADAAEAAWDKPGAIEDRKSKIENRQSKIADPQSSIQNLKSRIESPPLLIWAENPAPFYFTRDPIFRTAMQNLARTTHAFVIANTIVPVDAQGNLITNTAFTLDPEGREISRYDKIHLVPFGEYVPWWALPGLVHKITSEVGNFVPGSSYPVATTPGGNVGVFICYEAIIPQLARNLVAAGAGVLVNISNDGWYGDSAAAYQHLEMARLRAIENRRYLLRATNDGLTTLIDPYGRVLAEIPRYQRLALPAHFEFETRLTFYSAHGDVFAWLAAAVGALMLAASLRGGGKKD